MDGASAEAGRTEALGRGESRPCQRCREAHAEPAFPLAGLPICGPCLEALPSDAALAPLLFPAEVVLVNLLQVLLVAGAPITALALFFQVLEELRLITPELTSFRAMALLSALGFSLLAFVVRWRRRVGPARRRARLRDRLGLDARTPGLVVEPVLVELVRARTCWRERLARLGEHLRAGRLVRAGLSLSVAGPTVGPAVAFATNHGLLIATASGALRLDRDERVRVGIRGGMERLFQHRMVLETADDELWLTCFDARDSDEAGLRLGTLLRGVSVVLDEPAPISAD